MVDYIYRRCTKIFATSPSFVKRIEERDSAYETTEKKETEQSSRKSKVIYWPQYAEDFYKPVEMCIRDRFDAIRQNYLPRELPEIEIQMEFYLVVRELMVFSMYLLSL